MTAIPALEVGGSHVTAGLVSTEPWRVERVARRALDPHGSATELLGQLAAAATALDAPAGSVWGVAMPDPFDYDTGVARFRGVGKFDDLDGVDVSEALTTRVAGASGFRFRNDADAFAVGEYLAGAGGGSARLLGLTLGTGVGSGWLVDGVVVTDGPGVPVNGNVHELRIDGRPLEDLFSGRAIRAAFAAAGGSATLDVADICAVARAGDERAAVVLTTAASALGHALASSVRAFAPDRVVVGGSIAASWDLLDDAFRRGLAPPGDLEFVPARLGEHAGLIGAAALVADGTAG